MIDTLVHQLPAARALDVYARWNLDRKKYAVVTMHRPSNVDSPEQLRAISGLLAKLAEELPVVFPAHPRTEKRLQDLGLTEVMRDVLLCAPLGYREFISLVDSARVVVTDSGGIQEETSYLGVPCVTLRTSTERPVTVSGGTNVLVGDAPAAALAAAQDAIRTGGKPGRPIEGWDGHAAERIVDEIVRCIGSR
jgi:UDP-N-acetylglucosamine 2-epimerase (non-hydrolysing)